MPETVREAVGLVISSAFHTLWTRQVAPMQAIGGDDVIWKSAGKTSMKRVVANTMGYVLEGIGIVYVKTVPIATGETGVVVGCRDGFAAKG